MRMSPSLPISPSSPSSQISRFKAPGTPSGASSQHPTPHPRLKRHANVVQNASSEPARPQKPRFATHRALFPGPTPRQPARNAALTLP